MRNWILVLAGGAMLTLSGCGRETPGETTIITGENGEKAELTLDESGGEASMTITGKDGEATFSSGTDVKVTLPEGFSLYPGAKVVTNTVFDQADSKGAMVIFQTGDGADKVIAHFRKQAEEAGFDIQLEANTDGNMMIAGERKRDNSSLSVTASAKDGEATTGQLMIGSKPGG